MNRTILDLVNKRPVLLDGGMGTELIRRGLPQGACPETWNAERPEMVGAVHASYFDAGADAVSTNSFGGSRIKLAAHGLEARAAELNAAAARIAREVAPAGRFVAGSIGPTGRFLQPQGEFTEAEFEAAFAEQAGALAGGGADFLIVETQYDLREALAALRGARAAAPSLPVFVTLTFNAYPRGYFTLMGNTVAAAVEALEKEGASAVGANCTLDSREMVGLVRSFRQTTRLPIVAQANAGKPALTADGGVSYSQSLEEYVGFVHVILEAGANIVGGCCGTGPDHIRKMSELVHKRNIGERRDT
jgi:5-methyltetrahydrofolate--homocysteine methyltransferase